MNPDSQWLRDKNIPELFDRLVGQLVSNKPNDPVPFLIQFLQQEHSKSASSHSPSSSDGATEALTLTAFDTSGEMKLWRVPRRKPQATDVFIRIQFCGVCHSDLHQIRAEWPIPTHFPMTPGHEIVGLVEAVGPQCKKFKVGDRVGVGCLVDSCLSCQWCKQHGEEQYCEKGAVGTYNSMLNGQVTHGGYSSCITVREEFVVSIPAKLPLGEAAPLLCAGITTYSPLVHFGAKKAGSAFHVAVLGLGGLGHAAVKISKAMGNQVTVLSRGEKKKAFATKLGAKFVNYQDPAQVKAASGIFDLIIDTVSATHQLVDFVPMVKTSGRIVVVGAPSQPFDLPPMSLIFRRIAISGSAIGGIRETQECLDFCAQHSITLDVELIDAKDVNHALHKLHKGLNEHGRYVIKIAETLKPGVDVEKEPAVNLKDWKVMGIIMPPEANVHAKAK